MEEQKSHKVLINNDFYEDLKEKWYQACDHPVALLRAENAARTPWVIQGIEKRTGRTCKVLDIGCGAGFLANALAEKGHEVTGLDLSQSSLSIAKEYDQTQTVRYDHANAYTLPYEENQFDVVCAMDVIEHLVHPQKMIQEASRVLKPGGLFFFHTFNRNFYSYLMIIKGVEWCVRNTPKNMHVYDLFVTPNELKKICKMQQMHVESLVGLSPNIKSFPFWKMLFTRKVPKGFKFTFSSSLKTGYCGIASKKGSN